MIELREIVNYVQDDRAARDSKLRSILKSTKPVGPPESRRPLDQPPEPTESDYSEVDAEEERDLRRRLRRRGDKAFLLEEARSLTHLYPFA